MIYYKLKNGETIELIITRKETEDFEKKIEVEIKLFNGGMSIIQEFDLLEMVDLNKIFEYIEENYKRFEIEDYNNTINAYTN